MSAGAEDEAAVPDAGGAAELAADEWLGGAAKVSAAGEMLLDELGGELELLPTVGLLQYAERCDGGAAIIGERLQSGAEAGDQWALRVGLLNLCPKIPWADAQIKDQDIAVPRWGDGIGDGGMAKLGGVTARGIDEGRRTVKVNELLDAALVAHLIEIVEELGLVLTNELGNLNQSHDIGEGVVGVGVGDVVFLRDELQAVGGLAFGGDRPVNSLWAQGAGEADDVQ